MSDSITYEISTDDISLTDNKINKVNKVKKVNKVNKVNEYSDITYILDSDSDSESDPDYETAIHSKYNKHYKCCIIA
jgi:hypothetical protein